MLSFGMTAKARKAIEPAVLDVSADERHRDDVDQVIARNRDALNASIRIGREEIARGVKASRTIDDIISDGRKRYGAD
jgi:hypothetical protein